MPSKAAAASDTADSKKTVKIAIAGVAFVAAAALILFQLGVFSGEETIPPPPPLTEGMSDAERKQFEAEQARREKLDKIITPSGS
jgi:hypothetical protein